MTTWFRTTGWWIALEAIHYLNLGDLHGERVLFSEIGKSD
jgi:hypothetical protein